MYTFANFWFVLCLVRLGQLLVQIHLPCCPAFYCSMYFTLCFALRIKWWWWSILSVFVSILAYRKTSDRSPRLLSVTYKWIRPRPSCMRSSASIRGPRGLYHNMSSLCYFIQTNRQLSCLPGTSILFIFTPKHRILWKCKRGLQSLLYLLRNIFIRIASYN